MNTFSNKRQSWSTHRSRLLEVGYVTGGSFPVSNASHETEADESQSDLQVISLFKRNTYFLREASSGYSTASFTVLRNGRSWSRIQPFSVANELVMFSQLSPAHEITAVVAYLKAAAWISRRFFQAK